MLGRDFNNILFAHEKQGGLLRKEARMKEFENFGECQLGDIGFSRIWFTWERGNVIDRNWGKNGQKGC